MDERELTVEEAMQLLIEADPYPSAPLGEGPDGPYGPKWLLTPRNLYPRFCVQLVWSGSTHYGYELRRQDAPGTPDYVVEAGNSYRSEAEAYETARLRALLLLPDDLEFYADA